MAHRYLDVNCTEGVSKGHNPHPGAFRDAAYVTARTNRAQRAGQTHRKQCSDDSRLTNRARMYCAATCVAHPSRHCRLKRGQTQGAARRHHGPQVSGCELYRRRLQRTQPPSRGVQGCCVCDRKDEPRTARRPDPPRAALSRHLRRDLRQDSPFRNSLVRRGAFPQGRVRRRAKPCAPEPSQIHIDMLFIACARMGHGPQPGRSHLLGVFPQRPRGVDRLARP